jgi:hypothetical protein
MPDDPWDDLNPPDDLDEPERPKHAGGRPKSEISIDTLERAASIGCTTIEIAALLSVAPSTLFLRLSKEPELQEAIDRGRAKGRATLRRYQWHKAGSGSDTMLIWLGKQMLEQRDQVHQTLTGADNGPIQIEDTRTPIADLIAAARKKPA